MIRDFSPVYQNRHQVKEKTKHEHSPFHVDNSAVFMAYYHIYTAEIMTFVFFVFLWLLAYMEYLVERQVWSTPSGPYRSVDNNYQPPPYDPNGTTYPWFFSRFDNTLWFTIVTMASLGYGDIYPITQQGRLVAAITMITGITVISMMTTTLINKIELNDFDEAVANTKLIKKKHDNLEKFAAGIISVFFVKCRKFKDDPKKRKNAVKSSIRHLVKGMHRCKRQINGALQRMEGSESLHVKMQNRAKNFVMKLDMVENNLPALYPEISFTRSPSSHAHASLRRIRSL